MLLGNLITARQELEESAGLKQELKRLQAQIKAAGLEPDISPASTSPSSATELPTSTKPADIALTPDDQEEPASGQVSPSQISPFQSIAMQEPGLSWLQSSAQSAEGFSQAEGLHSGLQNAEPSVLYSASAVSQLQQQNAALKAELAQLTQREAAEEADVTGLQTQNRTLIGEVEKLRLQVGEVRNMLYLVHSLCFTVTGMVPEVLATATTIMVTYSKTSNTIVHDRQDMVSCVLLTL